MELKDWTQADADGTIHVPDELDKLFNGVGMQMRFHTISGKNEIQTIADIVFKAQKFFLEKSNERYEAAEAYLKANIPNRNIQTILHEQTALKIAAGIKSTTEAESFNPAQATT